MHSPADDEVRLSPPLLVEGQFFCLWDQRPVLLSKELHQSP